MLWSRSLANKARTLGINRVVDSALKSSGGVLNISTGDMTLITVDSDVISMRINVSWFAVSGLDTFTSFDVLEPISNFTIRNLLAMDRIECQVGVVIELEAGEGELNGIYAAQGMLPQSTAKAPRPSEIEHVVLSVTAKDISLNISALFAFDGELFGNLPLSSMYDDFVGCTLRSLIAANVSALRFSTQHLSPFSITGFVSSGLDHLSAELMESIDLMFYDSLLRALPALVKLWPARG